ncbi:MAG: DNA-methyltransferase, partial [Nitrososphaerales archaeon]
PDAIAIWDGDESCEHHQFEMEYFQISSNHNKNFNERWHGRGVGQRKQETSKQINSQRGFCVRCHAFKGQLGHEYNPDDYVRHLVEVFRELKRVLRREGSFFLNLSDKYDENGFLLEIPSKVCLALEAEGWGKREDIIWHKPNGIPESARNRFSRRWELLFHFVKSKRYFSNVDLARIEPKYFRPPSDKSKILKHDRSVGRIGSYGYNDPLHSRPNNPKGKNPGHLWSINCAHEKGPHPAAYPLELCYLPIVAFCPPRGTVLDPFCGRGTTLMMAKLLGRSSIGIEINAAYAEIAERNLREVDLEAKKLFDTLTPKLRSRRLPWKL